MTKIIVISAIIICLLHMKSAHAEIPTTMEQCLKLTDEAPDIAAAEANMWDKKGGGFQAKLCHASAQFKRQEFQSAAHEFKLLADLITSQDPKQAASLHAQAGLSFMRAQNNKEAEQEYAIALQLNANDPEIWLDRSTERAAVERYWDAISDATQALKLNPRNSAALRLRGQAWVKLGNDEKAEDDFLAAEGLDPSPQVLDK